MDDFYQETGIDDGGGWTLIIEYEDGEIVVGQLEQLTYELDDVEEFYDFLAEETCIENLFFFDGYVIDEEDDED